MKARRILGAAIGDCVHVAGVVNFLNLAEELGYETICLGPAVGIDTLLDAVREHDPEMVAVGYRLTPAACRSLLTDLQGAVAAAGEGGRRWLFGGTSPTAAEAQATGLFSTVFSGEATPQQVIALLRGEGEATALAAVPPQTLVERIAWKQPYPLIRHHYGQPTVDATVAGVYQLAAAGVLDVISLGTDQNAQEHFFRPHEMEPGQDGAGGVPVRTPDDLSTIYAHTRVGNHPLMRCYSGTRDTLAWAPMLEATIHNAWCATPLYWYSQMDGRSTRPLRESIPEAQRLMTWHGERGIPVEMNESHHWSLRDGPDVVAVTAAYLAAYNARAAGVRDYVQQLMFNTPPNTSPRMDLAKMLAKLELVESLQGPGFRVWRETRAGLTSFPADPDLARGHLAASVYLQMQLRPHILHVVAACEAHHAATAADIIESCRIADGAIRQCLLGGADMTADPAVQARKEQLLAEAAALINAIRSLAPAGHPDPLTCPEALALAAEIGLMDAPHLRGNRFACGRVVTRMVDGACVAYDPEQRRPLPEAERVARALARRALSTAEVGD